DSFDVALEDFSYEDFEGTTHEVRNAAFTVEPAPFRARSRLPEGVTLYFRGELDGTPFANADGGIQAGTGSDPNAQLSVNQGGSVDVSASFYLPDGSVDGGNCEGTHVHIVGRVYGRIMNR